MVYFGLRAELHGLPDDHVLAVVTGNAPLFSFPTVDCPLIIHGFHATLYGPNISSVLSTASNHLHQLRDGSFGSVVRFAAQYAHRSGSSNHAAIVR